MVINISPETLETVQIEVVEFDEEKAKLTIDNPENDWSSKSTNEVGEVVL
ncbi:hypothetical protein [[Clostridium] innocuum]|nr:hypothetical protein [[Clostridium] innocuum]QSI27772.1 hypothetical protein GKZ87_20825 [Erysipelotrichaceae bacterium 66202529]DAU14210.1 MAG TPA: hypothetical protein [Caudoviricetes sp.]MCC2832122.1 hypothetical protein [[Clostridium] innocuum]MCR0247048.1 hypothetical protein [[Clostridium] innocuum]MCR0258410.1 hypothetical protein [[Clostridium] innocuum]